MASALHVGIVNKADGRIYATLTTYGETDTEARAHFDQVLRQWPELAAAHLAEDTCEDLEHISKEDWPEAE